MTADAIPHGDRPLASRVALVTGSSRRIGRQIVLALADAGADVAVHARSNREEADKTAELVRAKGVRCVVVLGDVAVPDDVERLVGEVAETLGGLDILVNNASVRGKSTIETTSYEDWRRILGITLDGAFLCAKAARPYLVKSGSGRIISIGGASAHMGTPNHMHVMAAKMGLVGLTKALAHDLGPQGVTANIVSPGLIEDEADDPNKAAFRRTLYQVDKMPARRGGRPEEIAAAVVSLALPSFGYVTGQTIHVNGGVYMP